MDVYEFAIKMEQDGEQFYRKAAAQARDQGIRRILSLLADDEVKHCNTLKQMREAAPVQMAETAVLTHARNIFAQMQGQVPNLGGIQTDVYRQAQEIERRSQEFYQEKAEQVSDPSHWALFGRIAEEERRHFFLLEHVIEFLSRPKVWMENAEFNHLDEY
jgi:rubrerythrin